jgi:hypothetical protein
VSRSSFRRVLVAAGGALVLASVARADAPAGVSDAQYAPFDNSNVDILDQRTGLTWQRAVPPGVFTFPAAQSYCALLSLGNMTGWRVPSYKELLTLVDESPHPEYDSVTGTLVYKAIDSFAFGLDYTPVTTSYWSSSVSSLDPGRAYLVDFRTGATLTFVMGTGFLVRCVHD